MSKLKRFLQGATVVLILIVIMEVDWKIGGPEAMRHLAKVEGELGELRRLPNAVLMSKDPSVKTSGGILVASYKAQGVSLDDIERWYKEEFRRLNWRPISVESHQSKRLLRFCRNGEIATLILPEESLAARTDFEVDIDWESSPAC